MKSLVKHYKLQPDGSLRFVGDEIHEYSPKECPLQPETKVVLGERTSNGRRTVVLAGSPMKRGRRIDALKANLLGNYITEEIERKIIDFQYEGAFNADDESVDDLHPEFDDIEEEEDDE